MEVNKAILIKAQRWVRNPYSFLTECCYTKDEVAVNRPDLAVVRLIPKMPYIRTICEKWEQEPRLVLPKSRRMLVSWICTALEEWLCNFTENVVVYVIALEQTGADAFLARHQFIHEHLPPECPRSRINIRRGKAGDPTIIEYLDTRSQIEALSSKPDDIRGEGATLIRCEEMAFWQWAEASWKALLPTIQGGGRIVVVSSAEAGSHMRKVVYDELGQAVL
jgi:hypothetical protein